jgi:threonine-phosphate decarboxylase
MYGFQVFDSRTNYILFRAKGITDLKERLLSRGVLIRSCSNYVNLDADYYRVAVRLREANGRLIQAIREVL